MQHWASMVLDNASRRGPLPSIPLVDIGSGGPIALFESEPARALEIIRLGRKQYGAKIIGGLDEMSRLWSSYAGNAYNDEITEIAAKLPRGAWFMNLCLEWGCTSGVMEDPKLPGMRLLRTLDWPFHGLGQNLVIAKQAGPAGEFYNLTWPAFVGVVQAMAPGRFAVALNQAPLVRRLTMPVYVDWLCNKVKTFTGRRIPPVHLLRRVVETCQTFDEAYDMLTKSPIALPAIFSLVGTERGNGCIIERLERRAFVLEAPVAAANHWFGKEFKPGKSRGIDSYRRHQLMTGYTLSHVAGFNWLKYPIVNEDTRLAMSANPKSGELTVQGFESYGPATEVFDLEVSSES
ncbi:MAG: hypothetical protein CFH10_00554 [Alphaproteobacteria bacterium MarineAlpha4_Bin2]|nr:MAG: hypothetical protein CFH10_00554 [Alphaproteobacteria bacterium MarineAlpha4_Bin2]